MTPPDGYSGTIVRAAEETAARTIMVDPENKSESPDYQCQSSRDQAPAVTFVRDAYGGTETLRLGTTTYLPEHPMEDADKYAARVGIAVCFNGLKRTVGGLVGMLFRKDPQVEDLNANLTEHLKDIDRQGHRLAVFLRELAVDALVDGHAWIHVEEPVVDPLITTSAADAKAQGIRPYWLRILKQQARNWRHAVRAGRPVLTLFVYDESAIEPDGPFGERAVERRRELREGGIGEEGVREGVLSRLWELREDPSDKKPKWFVVEEHEIGVREVPIVFAPSEATGAFSSRPPLMDLAFEQVEHYRVRSDRQTSMTFSSIAVPYHFASGAIDAEGDPVVKWGPGGMLVSNDPEAQAGVIESHGFGLAATKEELQEIKAQMSALGLQMLVRGTTTESQQEKTATGEILGKSEGDASLTTFAISLEGAATEALRIHGAYLGIDAPGKVVLNKDFVRQLLDPGVMRELREFFAVDLITDEDVWRVLQQGEILPDAIDFEEMREKLGLQREVRLRAMQDMMDATAPPDEDDGPPRGAEEAV